MYMIKMKMRYVVLLVCAALLSVTSAHAYFTSVAPDCDFEVNDAKYNFAYGQDIPLVNIVALNNSLFKRHITYDGKKYVVGGYDLNYEGTSDTESHTYTRTGCSTLYLSEYMEPFLINSSVFHIYVFTNTIITPSLDFWLNIYMQSHSAYSLNHVRNIREDAVSEPTLNAYCESASLCMQAPEDSKDYNHISSITIPRSFLNRNLAGSLENFSTITEADLSAIDMKSSNMTMENCSRLQKVLLNPNTQIIPDGAFKLCGRLTDISLPQSVTEIGMEAFWPNSYGTMEALQRVEIGKLKSINFPAALATIGERAFMDNSLEEVVLGNNVRSIGSGAFSSNESLKRIKIGDGVKTLNCSFSWCKALEELTIGSRVELLGGHEFYGTTGQKLHTIECLNPTPPAYDASSLPFDEYVFDAATLYVRKGCSEAYKADAMWGRFANIIEKDFPEISPIEYIRKTSITLHPEETAQLQHILEAGKNPAITYKTADNSVATIESDGKITAVAPGQTFVYVIPDGREDLALTAIVSVAEDYPKVSEITISGENIVKVYDTIQLNAEITPEETPWTDVIWTSDNRKVAIVDTYGRVTGISEGDAVITATSTDGSDVKAQFTITVSGISGIEATEASDEMSYRVNGTSIEIENAKPHSVVRLYTIDGQLIDSENVNMQGEATVSARTTGLFIINCLDSHKKLILN